MLVLDEMGAWESDVEFELLLDGLRELELKTLGDMLCFAGSLR